nr:hypothetical protein CFP56_02149 [Quercus suber]
MDLPPNDAYGPPFSPFPLSIKTVWVVSTKNSPAEICLVRYHQLLDSMHPNPMLTRYAVGGPEYKQITAILKAMECLHRITAQLPLEDTNGANPEALEDIGQPSTSSTPANHSHGQHVAPHQVVSRPDPFPPLHASPAPEFLPPPHASPSPEIPPRTVHAVPDLEIPLPTAHASFHPKIPSPTLRTFSDPAYLSLTPQSFDLGFDFNETSNSSLVDSISMNKFL